MWISMPIDPEKRKKSTEATKRWRENNRERARAWQRQYSEKNREKHAAYRKAWAKAHPRTKLIEKAKIKGCAICEEKSPVALDFHHIDPSQKKFSIGGYYLIKTDAEVEEELAKCVVVCANCHRKIHAGLISLESKSSVETEIPDTSE